MKIETLHVFDTEYSADSIEWCPHSDYRTYFACGTYQLEESTVDGAANTDAVAACNRKGRIYLFKFERSTKNLNELQRFESAAVLDMKWLPSDTELPTLATATALGTVVIYTLQQSQLLPLCSLTLETPTPCLVLSLDWSPRAQTTSRDILVSDSKGQISVLEFSADKACLQQRHTWSAHGFEAWICAYDKWHDQRVYTGGDDCLLHVYDVDSRTRLLTNKSHTAGVTCLLSHPTFEHQLLTGSYDELLRVFDTRAMKQPLQELKLHGGIWRLKAHPRAPQLVLAACMYENFSVVDIGVSTNNAPQLRGVYKAHDSICYGADWCLDATQADDPLYMATCSFYDHKLCVACITREP